jgi:ACS family D-galactonate transporter-like MFS transporter
MVIPFVVGVIVKYGGFAAAMAFISAVALMGALSYGLIVGRVERVPDTAAP